MGPQKASGPQALWLLYLTDSLVLKGPCPGRVPQRVTGEHPPGSNAPTPARLCGLLTPPPTILLHRLGYHAALRLLVVHLHLLVFWHVWDNLLCRFVVNIVQGVSVLPSSSSVCFYVWVYRDGKAVLPLPPSFFLRAFNKLPNSVIQEDLLTCLVNPK